MFVIISVIYRPIEQLLSRTIAERRARGHAEHSAARPDRDPGRLRAGLPGRRAAHSRTSWSDHVFNHYQALYDVLVVGTLAYAASYFARGWLAGHQYFALYGGLVLMESLSRICFALAVALGITSGQTAVVLGIAAAPFVSLVVVPAAFARSERGPPARRPAGRRRSRSSTRRSPVRERRASRRPSPHDELSLRRRTGFAVWVSGIMLSEQTLLNAAVLTVDATSADQALAGIVFNVLLIARAPLQLFQAIQTSLLPHLTGLEATEGHEAFARAIRVTVLAIAAFAAAVALGLLAIGPLVMSHLFGQHYDYGRFGLALVGLGMGMHLTSGALNQAALARDRARAAAVLLGSWRPACSSRGCSRRVVANQLLRTEIGYARRRGPARARCCGALYRRGSRVAAQSAPAAATIAR